jgi:hypothetical protein
MYASSLEMNRGNATSAFRKPAPNSLVAFLRAIKFRSGAAAQGQPVERYFAQLTPRARQRKRLAEESCLVRSAN